jgi:hypothetical protein
VEALVLGPVEVRPAGDQLAALNVSEEFMLGALAYRLES